MSKHSKEYLQSLLDKLPNSFNWVDIQKLENMGGKKARSILRHMKGYGMIKGNEHLFCCKVRVF